MTAVANVVYEIPLVLVLERHEAKRKHHFDLLLQLFMTVKLAPL